MNKNVFPNFWQAFLIIIIYLVIWHINYVFFGLLIKNNFHSDFFVVLRLYLPLLIFCAIIIFVKRKSDVKISDYFSMPDFYSLFKLIIIIVLIRFVVLIPLDKPNDFFNFLINNKIRLHSTSIRPVILLFDLNMMLFIPIVEELFFRGLLLNQFFKKYSPFNAILLSSLLFGFYHLNPANFVFHFMFGIILGIIYYKSNSILIAAITHIIFNITSIFTWENIDLASLNSVVCITIYLVSILIVIFLIKSPMKTVKFSFSKSFK